MTGPESTGKTTLVKQLAKALNTAWVPEFARQYLERIERLYVEQDLVLMAKGQLNLEQRYVSLAKTYLVYDTDLITFKIWSNYKYGRCHDFILNNIESRTYDLYLLTGTEIPWEFDPQRENPEDRDVLYEYYKKELKFYNKNFFEVKGNQEERLDMALRWIKSI